MPISVTGSNKSAGFTLVEMMVVLAIVGLMTAVVAVNMPASGDDLVREGERLAARLGAARDNAILRNRETAAIIDANGYSFSERDGKAWRPLDEKPLAPAAWAEGTSPLGPGRISFDTVGMSDQAALVLVNGDNRTRLSVAASGEVSVDAGR
jgi:general secretion pathway protein H